MTDPSDRDRRTRQDDYRAARIGAATALIGVFIVLSVLDALIPAYDLSPVTIAAILGTVVALLGIEVGKRVQ